MMTDLGLNVFKYCEEFYHKVPVILFIFSIIYRCHKSMYSVFEKLFLTPELLRLRTSTFNVFYLDFMQKMRRSFLFKPSFWNLLLPPEHPHVSMSSTWIVPQCRPNFMWLSYNTDCSVGHPFSFLEWTSTIFPVERFSHLSWGSLQLLQS